MREIKALHLSLYFTGDIEHCREEVTSVLVGHCGCQVGELMPVSQVQHQRRRFRKHVAFWRDQHGYQARGVEGEEFRRAVLAFENVYLSELILDPSLLEH